MLVLCGDSAHSAVCGCSVDLHGGALNLWCGAVSTKGGATGARRCVVPSGWCRGSLVWCGR